MTGWQQLRFLLACVVASSTASLLIVNDATGWVPLFEAAAPVDPMQKPVGYPEEIDA